MVYITDRLPGALRRVDRKTKHKKWGKQEGKFKFVAFQGIEFYQIDSLRQVMIQFSLYFILFIFS